MDSFCGQTGIKENSRTEAIWYTENQSWDKDFWGIYFQCKDNKTYIEHNDKRYILKSKKGIKLLKKLVKKYPEIFAKMIEGLLINKNKDKGGKR